MGSVDIAQLLGRYSVLVLPVLVVAEQVGVPLPAVPALLAVGALAAKGHASIPLAIGAIVVVALPVDLIWHELGRRRGARLLSTLCRLSVEPDSCVRRTENLFIRYGVKAILAAKFLPGLTTVMPPLAGIFGVPRRKFALYEVSGVCLWAGFWTGLGYLFSDALEVVAMRARDLGRALGVVVALALVAYILFKYVRRRLFLRRLWIARIAPEDLKQKLEAGDDVLILDLRTALDVAAAPYVIPGSRWISTDALDEHASEIARDRDLVLYCT
ncbi:MAG TPA: VTT domain-containing protein [Candidatus Methylomirabilis sp.]|nr:VTT domain-containing protein [Candidatus Methylomirabilis sp.]